MGDQREPELVRRFVAVVQDERGYPPPGSLEPAPPDGPKPPQLLSVVTADDYDALAESAARVREERDEARAELAKTVNGMAAGQRSEFHGRRAIESYQRAAELAVDEKRRAEALAARYREALEELVNAWKPIPLPPDGQAPDEDWTTWLGLFTAWRDGMFAVTESALAVLGPEPEVEANSPKPETPSAEA